jgi:hypothetical protein
MRTDISDYWMHFVSEYGRNSYHVAPRIFDLAPNRWEELSAIYYARHGFKAPPKDDSYIGPLPNGVEAIRSHRIDALVLENPTEMDDMAKFLYDGWLGKKASLAKSRSEEPRVVILPPPPEPPKPTPKPEPVKKPKPIELPPKEEPEKKNPNPNLVRFSVYFGIISAAATAAALFFPPAKPFVVAIVAIVKSLLAALGV